METMQIPQNDAPGVGYWELPWEQLTPDEESLLAMLISYIATLKGEQRADFYTELNNLALKFNAIPLPF